MKIIVAAALAVLVAAPALAQTATQAITGAVTQAAKDTASQAASEQVNKALGTPEAKDAKSAKVKANEPNRGMSTDHRMDDVKKGHGKGKDKKNK